MGKDVKGKCHERCIEAKKWKGRKKIINVPIPSPSLSNEPSVSGMDPVTINFEQTLRISSPNKMNPAQQIVYANTIVNIVEASNANVQATCVVTDQKVTQVSGR